MPETPRPENRIALRGVVLLAALIAAAGFFAAGRAAETDATTPAPAGTETAPADDPDGVAPEWPEGFTPFPDDPWIAFNRAKGEVRVAAALSPGLIQIESPLDFLLLSGVRTQDGYWDYERGYESVFVTRARPDSLFFSLMLSGLKPGDAPLPEERNTNSAGHVQGEPVPQTASRAPAARVRITVEWRDAGGGRQTAPAEYFLRDRATGKPPTETTWLFTGSYLAQGGADRGQYLAALDSRVLAATFFDETALLNRAGESVNPYQTDDGGVVVAAEALPPEFRRTRVAEYGEEKRTIWLPRAYPATLVFSAAP